MKKIILCAISLSVFAACNNNKAEREAEIQHAQQASVDSVNQIIERERLTDSLNATAATEATISASPEEPTVAGKPTRKPTKTNNESGNVGTSGAGKPNTSPQVEGGGTPSGTTTTDNDNTTMKTEGPPAENPVPEEKKKKGINNTVKGAVIGAGAGAIGGAIINKKNPGKGAIIGGVVGAGAGAVTGVILDKNKKKKDAKKDSTGKNTTTKEPEPTGTTK